MAGGDPTWGATWDVLRDVVHHYSLYLDSAERETLWFIFSRTRLFRKEWEAITIRQFECGIVSADGQFIAAPITIGHRALLASLKHLEGKGIIEVKRETRNGGSLPNMYRIKESNEIITTHVFSYMKVNQPKTFDRMTELFAKSAGMQRVLQGKGTVRNAPRVSAKMHQGVSAKMHQYKEPNRKEPILKSAPRALKVNVLRKTITTSK